MSCAVALANLDMFEREDVLGNVAPTRPASATGSRRCATSRSSATCAAPGYFLALELVQDQATQGPVHARAERGAPAGLPRPRLFEAGLICRADDRGDPVVQLAPPLIAGTGGVRHIEPTLRTPSPKPGSGPPHSAGGERFRVGPHGYVPRQWTASPGTIVIWSDIGCPSGAPRHPPAPRDPPPVGPPRRGRSSSTGPSRSSCSTNGSLPRRVLAAEVPGVAGLAPEAGWQEWDAPEWEWPVTTLPALEAVQAASAQDGRAAEELDRAAAHRLLGDSRCISMRHVILEVASKCEVIDLDALAGALDDGVARRAVMARFEQAERSDEIKGSPHLFLPDGSSEHNPGIEMHWEGRPGEGFPSSTATIPRSTASSSASRPDEPGSAARRALKDSGGSSDTGGMVQPQVVGAGGAGDTLSGAQLVLVVEDFPG